MKEASQEDVEEAILELEREEMGQPLYPRTRVERE